MTSSWNHNCAFCLAGVGVVFCAFSEDAHAYDKPWDHAKVWGAVSVNERDRTAYEPDGIRVGNFLLLPEIGYGISWTGGYGSKQGLDFRHEVFTNLEVRSQLPSHSFGLLATGRAVRYQDSDDLSYTDGGVNTTFRIEVDHATALFGKGAIQYGHIESIDSERPKGAASPPGVVQTSAELGLTRNFGRIDATVGARYQRVTYEDFLANDGSRVEQNWQDYSILSPYTQLEYRFSPGYSVFGRLAANFQDNRGNGLIDRDATGGEATAGVRFELSPLARVALSAGWVTQDYRQAGLSDISAPIWSGSLEWLVTPLVTLTFSSDRQIKTTANGDASGRLVATHGIKAQYEMWRNLVITAGASISQSTYFGQDKQDIYWIGGVGAEYAHTKNWLLRLSYEHQELLSSFADGNRSQDKIGFNVRYRY